MTNPHNKAREIIDLITAQKDMSPSEKLDFMLDIAQFCIQWATAILAYDIRKNPEHAAYMDIKIEDINNWIYKGIKKGNEMYKQELN